MTNDFNDLTRALRAMPPADPAARAEAIALAMKNFDALQGSPAASRPTVEHTRTGFLTGARMMLRSLASRPVLAATTSVAALTLGLIVVMPPAQSPLAVTAPDLAALPQAAPAPAPRKLAPPGDAAAAPDVRTEAPALSQRLRSGADTSTLATAPVLADAEQGPAVAAQPETTLGRAPEPTTEAFANADPNPVRITADDPVSTFSIDVDTASYAVIRSSLTAGRLPDPAAVRVEEMVNYFPYTYPAPETDPFRATVGTLATPWNPGTKLVHIALQGRLPKAADRPALNLVFLIDTSGSMDEPNKLPLLKQSLRLMLGQLRPKDQVAIVAYAGSAGEVLPPTDARDSARILSALDNLAAGGSTAGAEGLALAYSLARSMTSDGGVSRILLATDGDFNVGVSDPDGLAAYVARNRDIAYLSILGFGRGNLDDATMQALAQNGNGIAAYIDTLAEAQKTLVDHLSGAMFPIADDVKIEVEWNPAQVAEYRLIGYETRALARQDFNNDRVDAGEVGAGHQVTALYEITAPGSPALRHDPLRYGAETDVGDAPELGFLRLRYKTPGSDTSALIEMPITDTPAVADGGFAAAMAGFGQLLQGSADLDGWGWDQAIAFATSHRGADPFGYRAEAVTLMRLAQSLSQP